MAEEDFTKSRSETLIYIYGTTHLLQVKTPIQMGGANFCELSVGKLHYSADLTRILCEHPSIGLVAEEANALWPSIAQEISLLGIKRYVSIDMPKAERERRGIPENEGPTIDMTQKENREAARSREQYMYERVAEWLPECGDVLLVCGMYHVRGLKQKFETGGCKVIADGILCQDWCKDSYVGSSKPLMMLVCNPNRL